MRRTPILVFLLLAMSSSLAQGALPAYILQLPESVSDVFIADTGTATIYRYEQTTSGVNLGHEGYMSIGRQGVGKDRAGDRRTPLGVYFVVDQRDSDTMHEKYGVTAFPLDYPNVWDRKQARTGAGIWVHGVLPNEGQRPPLDTDGCIALPNKDLAALKDRFVPLVTPVIVTREMHWQDAGSIAALRSELNLAIKAWAKHYGEANLHAYLSMYADNFSYRGMQSSEWASFRVQTLERRGVVNIAVDDLLLLADPEEDGLFLSRFHETMSGSGVASRTIKRLYWRRNDEGELRIVAEDNG